MGFYYPVSLNLAGKKCTVIGGGRVAQRKVQALLAAGAEVRVVAPGVTRSLQELARSGQITWSVRNYGPSCLEDSILVFAATNDRQVNSRVAADCKRRKILVNVADSLQESDFTVNSSFRQGDLMVAVSTNGKSPALAARITKELRRRYGPRYAVLLEILGEAREMALRAIDEPGLRNRKLKELVESEIPELVMEGRVNEARERVRKCLSWF